MDSLCPFVPGAVDAYYVMERYITFTKNDLECAIEVLNKEQLAIAAKWIQYDETCSAVIKDRPDREIDETVLIQTPKTRSCIFNFKGILINNDTL